MNTNVSCELQFKDSYNKYIADGFVTSCSPFTIIFNSFVIYLSLRYANLNQSLDQWFVLNMTLADLLVGLIYMTTVKINKDIPRYFCRLYYILVWSINDASVMFLLLLNIHKVVILFFPIYSFAYMSRGKVLLQALICWLLVIVASVCFSLEPALTFFDTPCHSCIVRIIPKSYFIMMALFYILPLVISLGLSVLIFGFAQKRSRRRSVQGTPNKERQKMFARIFFVFTSTIWTGVTCLPYRISLSKIQLCLHLTSTGNYAGVNATIAYYSNDTSLDTANTPQSPCMDTSLDLTQCVFLCLLAFGSVVNPLITMITQQKYRDGIKDIWGKLVAVCCTSLSEKKKCTTQTTCSYDAVKSEDL